MVEATAMDSSPLPTEPDGPALWRALRRLPGRHAQLLMSLFVERREDAVVAALYGIGSEALEVHRLRAATLLVKALSTPGSDPVLPVAQRLSFAEERRRARRLTAAISGAEPASGDPELQTCAHSLQALRRQGAQVQAAAESEALAWERSPEHRRAELIRKLALVALIALAAWLYFRSGGGPG